VPATCGCPTGAGLDFRTMDLVEFTPTRDQYTYTFGGVAPVMNIRPGMALRVFRSDRGARRLRRGGSEGHRQQLRRRRQIRHLSMSLPSPQPYVSPQWRDEDLYRRSTRAVARMGFGGRVCIHPRQVATASEIFTPTTERLEWAKRELERFDSATSAGLGVAVDNRGQMIDEAVVRIAQRINFLGLLSGDDHRTV